MLDGKIHVTFVSLSVAHAMSQLSALLERYHVDAKNKYKHDVTA